MKIYLIIKKLFFNFYFLFLKTKNKLLLNNTFELFSIVFTHFLKIVLKNHHINMEND